MKKKIKEIMPASLEFHAVFVDEKGVLLSKPVVCWAVLAVEEKEVSVAGMCEGQDGIVICNDDAFDEFSFVGYAGPGENPADLSLKATRIADMIRLKMDEGEKDAREEDNINGIISDLNEDLMMLGAEEMMTHLPVVLSQLSVVVREQFESGNIPPEWNNWIEFMEKFAVLTAV